MTSPALRLVGIGSIVLAAMLWGTTGTVQAYLPADRDPVVVGAMRMALGALSLWLMMAVQPSAWRALGRVPLRIVLGAGAAMAAYNLCFFLAVSWAGVGLGTALAIGSAPIWVALVDLARGIRPTGRRLLGQAVCIAGAAVLVLSGRGVDASVAGMVLALLAGASYATYSLLTSTIPDGIPPTVTAALTFSVAAVLLAPSLALLPLGWIDGAATWGLLLFLGAVATGVSYVLYTLGLRYVAPGAALTLALVEPLTAWLLATALLGEPSSAAKTGGALLLMCGLALVVTSSQRREG